MAKQPQENPAADAAEAPKKKRGKLVIIAGVLVLALGGGGAAAWYFTRPADPNAPKVAEPEKPAQFLALESFTVNLAGQDNQAQYLQAGLTLKLGHEVKLEAIKERMPEIRNRILLVLSGKKANELLPVAGKQKLALELSDSIREILGDSAGLKSAKHEAKQKVAKGEAESEGAEAKDAKETKEGDTAAAEGESKPAPKAAKAAAAEHVAKNDVEVLFTSFIIQ
jgi:flagellar FliL protein